MASFLTRNSNGKDVDLAGLYAQHMEHHGCGKGLFLPVAVADLAPPCCGFFDRNGDWNLISRLEYTGAGAGAAASLQDNGFVALMEPLRDVTSIDIKWQPKTSTGVQEQAIDTSAGTSANVAGGADAHIKYTSGNKFGAVLMTMKPVVLKAFHQERIFLQWLEDNKRKLHEEYGNQLRRYGLWIITKTYSTHGASINAWYNEDKDILVSIAAKANMLGELKSELNQSDKVMDKDWSHYFGNGPYTGTLTDERVVVFADGIEMKPSYWWLKSLEYALPGNSSSSSSAKSRSKSKSPNPAITRIQSEELPLHNPQSFLSPQSNPPAPRRLSENRTSTLVDEKDFSLALPPQPAPLSLPSNDHDDHQAILADAFGGQTSLSRAPSIRHSGLPSSRPPSLVGDTNTSPQSKVSAQARTPSRGSLRRDARDVSEIRRKDEQTRLSGVSFDDDAAVRKDFSSTIVRSVPVVEDGLD